MTMIIGEKIYLLDDTTGAQLVTDDAGIALIEDLFMAQPPVYNRLTSFSNLTALSPSTPPPGNDLDAEYNAIKTTLDATLENLALLQNDDTTLKNASVGPAQLSPQLLAGFTSPTVWATGKVYTASPASCVLQGTAMYTCLISHVSGVFATDLAAGAWLKIFDLTALGIVTAANVTVTPSGSLTTDVQTSLQALDAGKAPASHTHPVSQLSDSTFDGRAFITTNLAGQKALLGLGSLAFLNSVSITAIANQLAFTGKITPAALTTDTNDFAPTGIATNSVLRVSSTGAVKLTGLLATTDGDIKYLENVGTNNITLTAQDTSSSAANRFASPRPVVLRAGQSATLKYDGTASLWRIQSPITTSARAGGFKNLILGNAGARNGFTAPGSPDTRFLVTYDELVLEDASGETWRVTSGSHTIDTMVTGAVDGLESAFSLTSQKIFVWVIGNPTTNTIGALMSVSSTSPTLPSGYTFQARVGATQTDSSSHLLRTLQQGRRVQYVTDVTHALPTLVSGSSGTATFISFVGTSTSVANLIPATASMGRFVVSDAGASNQVALAPNANYGGSTSTTPPPISGIFTGGASTPAAISGEFMLESANVFYASSGASGLVQVLGWEDNL